MGTKNNPGKFDCYANAMPDEPMFHLLARDPDFGYFVTEWATRRKWAIQRGERPASDMAMVNEALVLAEKGREWRRKNDGAWRNKT